MKYFNNKIEYPKDIATNILPMNTQYNYISSTFLDGFINYVDIKCAFVHARYHRWNENLDHEINIKDNVKDAAWNWTKFKGTKEEVFNELIKEGAVHHSKLDSDFQDDVLILAQAKREKQYRMEINKEKKTYKNIEIPFDEPPTWYFFWYDRDCSDSSIGRFQTDDSEDEVIKYFKDYIMNLPRDLGENETPREIPIHYFQGWLSS